jgi:signal transduction histidine kinase/ligand-binding sensor domain-containing protein
MSHRQPFRKSCLVLALLVLALGMAANRGAAGAEDFLVEVWDTDSGLPHSTVTSIAQTPDGYLWVGTLHGGLARFDGQRFVNFHPGNTPELRSIEIQKLLVDALGTLWVGTVEGALISYRDGRFRFERQSTETPQAWLSGVVSSGSNSVVLSSFYGWLFHGTRMGGTNRWETLRPDELTLQSFICADKEGVIWRRTHDGRLGQVRSNQFVRVPNPPGLRSPQINTLVTDAAGQLWAGTEKELACWDGQAFVNMTPTNGEPELSVRQMALCPDGALWVRTDHGLRKCRGRQWVARVESWDGEGLQAASFPVSMFGDSRRMFGDSRGGVWVLHYGDGLWHADASGKVSRVREAQGLPNALVEAWFEDREGNVWLGLNGGGLACVRVRTFHTVWPTGGATHLAARSICEDVAGAMWFGTSGNTLLRWRNGEFTNFTPPIEQAVGFDTTVFPGDAGRLWVGSVQNGVVTLENEKFNRPFPSGEIGTVARVIYQDHRRRVWIGNEFGLFCWEREKLKRFTAADGFPAAFVQAITGDAAGDLWIGTGIGELWRYRDGKFTNYRPQDTPTTAQSFAAAAAADPMQDRSRGALTGGERFWALHADAEGVIWIGTLGGGLLRFEGGAFTRYTPREGLPSEHINQILEDQRGQLWLGTRSGIARVSKAELNRSAHGEMGFVRFVTYGKFDGLPTVECAGGSQPACWRSRDGRLWFSTVKGAVWTDPAEVRFNPLPPPVVIEEISVDGQRVAGGMRMEDGGLKMEKARDALPSSILPPPSSHLEIPPGRHYLDFKFTAPSLTSPDKVRFKWRLAGLEPDWVRESSRRSVSYSFVPPGDYEFQVQACNNDGVWNEPGAFASLKLRVLPYFWQAWWFKTGAPLLGFGLVGGAIYWSLRRRQRMQLQRLEHARALAQERLEHQQAMERERARIAQDLHDDLGASLTHVAWLGELASREEVVAAERQGLVTQITAKSRDMVRAIDEIVWAVNPKNDSLDHLVTYVCEFAEQFFRDTPTRCRVDVQELLPAHALPSDVRHNLFLAAKEALHNVAKHAGARQVWVRVKAGDDSVQFVIEDDGCGFAPGAGTTGDGLENMRRRSAAIGAKFELHSTPGQGTSVTWKLPLHPAGPLPQNHP